MNESIKNIILKFFETHSLTEEEYCLLIAKRDEETFEALRQEASRLRDEIYGKSIFIRGLIEVSNYCKNDCFYCGIRKSNKSCERYRLTKADILSCCENGYELGFRTFVLQGGEDAFFSDEYLAELLSKIKGKYSDCAVTLSLGERSKSSYQKLFDAGADRYLLRHETADSSHYAKLHPSCLKLSNRIECLNNLKDIGFQVGC